MKNRCTPHSWKLPVPGDIELECVKCGRRLHLRRDITPTIRAAILNSLELRTGADPHEFQGFFGFGPMAGAFEAARPPEEAPERPVGERRESSFSTPAPAWTFPDRRRKPGERKDERN